MLSALLLNWFRAMLFLKSFLGEGVQAAEIEAFRA